ncbi:hypothetical protein AWC38_SpisGene20718 [Stylophora pistillata]|uniref:Uncharacterized protein n=1 Tax=Stylophora pistillata TaxID=50429 RepID=A0A2B4RF08_STYPI|nr:hypothetical protein AWC38_SpisGene20718 [Stylophora pistillata]
MHQYKHCTNYNGNLYNRAWCPICPRDDGVLIESMDGCFGLCRKKDKGHDLGTPKHGTLLFADQLVDERGVANIHSYRNVNGIDKDEDVQRGRKHFKSLE